MQMRPYKISLLLLVAAVSLMAKPVYAGEQDDYEPEKSNFGETTSMDASNGGAGHNADALLLQADHEGKMGHYDKAIFLCKNAIKADPDDIDVHQGYAEALERKLHRQVKKDPDLFIAAVHQWLIVLRSEVGDEKGMVASNGLTIPFMNKFYEDDERSMVAKQHLISLVGYVPKAWETDKKYLARVSKAAESSVHGHIIKSESISPGSRIDASKPNKEF